ncbi:MAG: VWA domain-containing protein [Candidatus Omnitrophica bacterium]|nr:VWA domain-containing protein [Candidatus Omnitrophota bacterium]
MSFKSPLLLILIPTVLPILVAHYFRHHKSFVAFSSSSFFKGLKTTWKMRAQHLPFFLRILSLALFILAFSGPRVVVEESKITTEGIDIVLLVDTSTSMAAEDFTMNGKRANRLSIIKKVVNDFIQKRKSDKIGLIAFAAKPYTVCPLTMDYAWLTENLNRIQFGIMDDGTAIGSAIASGVNRLRGAKGKSKVMVLLTDGINNAGKIDPLTAAKTAEPFGIKIYTIGAGTRGLAPYPVTDLFGRTVYQNVKIEVDEETLKKIAEATGGQYFRATDTESLENIYKQIDQLEKTKIEESGYRQYNELFGKILWVAILVLLMEVVLGRTVFLRIP